MKENKNHLISKISAEEIKDSRGNPTIKVTAWAGDYSASFSVPSGASTGIHEVHELRDLDGKGVKSAIDKVNKTIAESLVGQSVLKQKILDDIMVELDGTPNKDNLGGNSILGVSIACAKLAAKVSNQKTYEYLRTLADIKPSRKVPYLFMNLLEGGKHTDNGLAFQEYHVVPESNNVKEALDIGIKLQNTLEKILVKDLGKESLVLGDEGGFAPRTSDVRKPLLYLTQAIKENNLEGKVHLALDVAASSFYKNGLYCVDGKDISKDELIELYESLIKEFKIFSIEDPFNEEDFSGFKTLKEINKKVFIVGDDLTVTNKSRLKKAIEQESINAIIVKPNQIGTLSETIETIKLARDNSIETIISHRSGETEDDFIADLAYAFGCFGLKAGSSFKRERMLKYQRLIEISK